MFGKQVMWGLMVLMGIAVSVNAQTTAQSYLEPGREALFSGTLSGIRAAAQLFEEGLNDVSCSDCQDSRELLFFHAISRIAMWVAKDNGTPVDSGIELAKAVGIEVNGDEIRQMTIDESTIPEDRYGRLVFPDNHEELISALADFRDETAIPELTYIIEVLDRITETSTYPFKVFLTPSETQIFLDPEMPPYTYDMEVDYGDVLLLKGTVSMVKALLTLHSAYDLYVSEEAMLMEKVVEDMFSIQNDLLLPNPDFLKLLPTNNDPSDGKNILDGVRQDIVAGLQFYLDTLDYLLDESKFADVGELDSEFFAIDPADVNIAEGMREKVDELLVSLLEDTAYAIEGETWKWYELANSEQERLGIDVTIDWLGLFVDGFISVTTDDIELGFGNYEEVEFELVDNRLCGYFDGFVEGYEKNSWGWIGGYCGGYFSGLLNDNHTAITDGSFEYWGDIEGRIENLSGQVEWQETEPPFIIDLNPILGGTGRYPDPVSPRDLLCEFGAWNKPSPDTIGQGMGGDPSLGGILPEVTEQDWQKWIDPQPTEKLPLPLLEPWQMVSGWPTLWLQEQLIFEDSLNDAEEWMEDITGVDIDKLYLGFDEEHFLGCIELKDMPDTDGTYLYRLSLSPSPKSHEALDSVVIDIIIENGTISGNCFILENIGGYSAWRHVDSVSVVVEDNQIMFKLPLDDLPCNISGRYLTIDSLWGYDDEWLEDADINRTHIQIGRTGSISGQVEFPGYRGGPIFVRAFTDLMEPEESIVSFTVLDEPGTFSLSNIGLGLNVYVEAFCPLFGGYHPFNLDALKVSTIDAVSLESETFDGLILNLRVPPTLRNQLWEYGELLAHYNRNDYYAFDAIKGAVYTLELDRSSDNRVSLSLIGRNGSETVASRHYWQTQQISWICPLNGRYYLRVSEPEWSMSGGAYQVRMTTSLDCPFADISGSQWSGVKDCNVDIFDFVMLASYWIQGCAEPYWCEESDYDKSGHVDYADFVSLAESWQFEPNVPDSLNEDFESGNFSKYGWQHSGSAPWVIVLDFKYEGTYAAKSGDTTHNQNSSIGITVDTLLEHISFNRKVSSESGYDYLRFYIDGIEIEKWSGNQDWAQQTYVITPGQHTFTWFYTKDGSVSDGLDSAWIDNIRIE